MDKLLESSKNPKELSLTVQGFLMALVPLAIALFKLAEIEVTETMLVDIIQEVTAITAGIVMLVGMFRKVFYATKHGKKTKEK
jgi:hypothetical protein